jgi:hypothetical protein
MLCVLLFIYALKGLSHGIIDKLYVDKPDIYIERTEQYTRQRTALGIERWAGEKGWLRRDIFVYTVKTFS